MKSSKPVEQRRQQIVAWVKKQGQSQVEDLAVRFATSEVTIRKDLAALSQQGLLIRPPCEAEHLCLNGLEEREDEAEQTQTKA